MKIASIGRSCLTGLLIGCVVNLGAGGPRSNYTSSVGAELIELDPFIVNGIRQDLPWRYAQAGDYEVLSLCSIKLTVEVLEALQRGHAMIPPIFRVKRSEPVTVILLDDQSTQYLPRLKATRKLYDYNKRFSHRAYHTWCLLGPEISSDREALAYVARVGAGSDWEDIVFDYARHSFLELVPPPVAWLREGLFGEYGLYVEGTTVSKRDVFVIPSMPRLIAENTIASTTKAEARPLFVPLEEFLSESMPDRIGSPEAYRCWQSQSLLFVRWALTAKKNQPFGTEAFWRFARQAGRSRPSEALFQECFQRRYAETELELQEYYRDAISQPADIDLPGLQLPTSLRGTKLRPATEGEIARLKGNFERMEANRLRAKHPKLAQQYEVEARRTLKRGLKATDNDSQLRGILGLLEFDAGNMVEARPHLEIAAAANQAGTHALIALAKLRLDEERASLPAEAKLSAAALECVLIPLFAARARRPSVVDVYLLIAEAWSLSATPPTRGNLSVLIEGTEFFPQDTTLLLRAAKLHARNGFTAETVALAEQGMKTPGDPAAKARFAEIISAGSPSP